MLNDTAEPGKMSACLFVCGRFYGDDVRACEILSGQVEPPSQCSELYSTLSHHEDMLDKVIEARGRQAISRGCRMTGVSYVVIRIIIIVIR